MAKSKCVEIGIKSFASFLPCPCLQAESDLLKKKEADPSFLKVCYQEQGDITQQTFLILSSQGQQCCLHAHLLVLILRVYGKVGLDQGDMKMHAFPKYSEEGVWAEGVGEIKMARHHF